MSKMENEKRLIDANTVIKEIDNYYHNSPFPHPGTPWRRGFEFAAELILKAPTVDAVEVVLCKDCKTYSNGTCWKMRGKMKPDDFCSYGERKDNER